MTGGGGLVAAAPGTNTTSLWLDDKGTCVTICQEHSQGGKGPCSHPTKCHLSGFFNGKTGFVFT